MPAPWVAEPTSIFSTAQRLRMCLEELGPTFIKFGQILSAREDLLDNEYLNELKKLQDDVPALPFEQLQNILKKQYPQGVEKVFQWIEPKPIGSASIAQVHRAQLISGALVVLKIQKPKIKEILLEDLEVLRFLAEAVGNWSSTQIKINLLEIVEEFANVILQEIDFLQEAQNTIRFYENFKKRDSVIIPKPYLEHSGSEVFVMECIQGLTMKDFLVQATPAQKKALAVNGLNAYMSMIFKDGIFHADLHSGNMMVMNDMKLAIVDFGMVGRLSKKVQQGITNLFLSLSEEDYDRMAFEYIELAGGFQKIDREKFAADLRKLFSPSLELKRSGSNIALLMNQAINIGLKRNLTLPAELVLLMRSLLVLEGMAKSLYTEFNWLEFIADKSTERQLPQDPYKAFADFVSIAREFNAMSRTLPMELRSYWKRKNHPSYSEKIEIANLEVLVKAQIKSAKIIFFALIVSSLIVSATLIYISQ